MPSLPQILLLTAPVTAQLTTSAWYLGSPDSQPFTFLGSIIAFNDNLTTIAVRNQHAPSDASNTLPAVSDTITLGGLTYAAFTITAYVHLFDGGPRDGAYRTDITERLACSRTNDADDASATCEISTVGASATLAEDCSRFAQSAVLTTTATVTIPLVSAKPTVYTEEMTLDYRSQGPGYCGGNDGVPQSAYVSTGTFEGGEQRVLDTVQLVVTAGLDKLDGDGSAAISTTTMTTGRGVSGSASASLRSGSATSAQTLSMGAAAPARTAAPALVGLGAAAVAFFL
ncbi:hypothetical protein T440DRAFT_464240 [Plenodomus tracheiphilus IPT5]|uniref:Uncharacterized protein n=1 Tax=Plenodomus tracheiphilus IPT5 TaxID=1408161 RepID=A0A6A7BL85_9PLEO|nr:hypothetical protein T440DRAFT_464240 [Plenodomus tracheiphilus IPT5]